METKNTKTCAYCGKEFEDTRSNKIYCSTNCVQKANYHKKKNSDKINIQDEEIQIQENKTDKFIFSVAEFEQFNEFLEKIKENPTYRFRDLKLSFHEYCFFRKDIVGKINFEMFVVLYNETIIDEMRANKNTPLSNQYKEFISEFSTKYVIDTYTKQPIKKEENNNIKINSNLNDFPTNFR